MISFNSRFGSSSIGPFLISYIKVSINFVKLYLDSPSGRLSFRVMSSCNAESFWSN
jgi:hypothetical protein